MRPLRSGRGSMGRVCSCVYPIDGVSRNPIRLFLHVSGWAVVRARVCITRSDFSDVRVRDNDYIRARDASLLYFTASPIEYTSSNPYLMAGGRPSVSFAPGILIDSCSRNWISYFRSTQHEMYLLYKYRGSERGIHICGVCLRARCCSDHSSCFQIRMAVLTQPHAGTAGLSLNHSSHPRAPLPSHLPPHGLRDARDGLDELARAGVPPLINLEVR